MAYQVAAAGLPGRRRRCRRPTPSSCSQRHGQRGPGGGALRRAPRPHPEPRRRSPASWPSGRRPAEGLRRAPGLPPRWSRACSATPGPSEKEILTKLGPLRARSARRRGATAQPTGSGAPHLIHPRVPHAARRADGRCFFRGGRPALGGATLRPRCSWCPRSTASTCRTAQEYQIHHYRAVARLPGDGGGGAVLALPRRHLRDKMAKRSHRAGARSAPGGGDRPRPSRCA